jgi:hypothetical protein
VPLTILRQLAIDGFPKNLVADLHLFLAPFETPAAEWLARAKNMILNRDFSETRTILALRNPPTALGSTTFLASMVYVNLRRSA